MTSGVEMKQKDCCDSVNFTEIELKFGMPVAKINAKHISSNHQNVALNCARHYFQGLTKMAINIPQHPFKEY